MHQMMMMIMLMLTRVKDCNIFASITNTYKHDPFEYNQEQLLHIFSINELFKESPIFYMHKGSQSFNSLH